MADSSCCLMGKQLETSFEGSWTLAQWFLQFPAKSHTNGPNSIFRWEQPSLATQQFQRLGFETTALFLIFSEVLRTAPCPYSLSRQRLSFQAECRLSPESSSKHELWASVRETIRKIWYKMELSVHSLAFLTPENRLNRCQDDSLISLPCFIWMLHKQDGIKNKTTGGKNRLNPVLGHKGKKRYLVA